MQKILLLAFLTLNGVGAEHTGLGMVESGVCPAHIKQPQSLTPAQINNQAMTIYLKAAQTGNTALYKQANELFLKAFAMGSGGASNNIAHMILRSNPPYEKLELLAQIETALYYFVIGMQRNNYQSAQALSDLLVQGYFFQSNGSNKKLANFYHSISVGLKSGKNFSSYNLTYKLDKTTHRLTIMDFLTTKTE